MSISIIYADKKNMKMKGKNLIITPVMPSHTQTIKAGNNKYIITQPYRRKYDCIYIISVNTQKHSQKSD